jgi:hypothetical protein
MTIGFRVPEQEQALVRFGAVKLRTDQEEGGVRFPAGSRGILLDLYDDGTCEVEFSSPIEDAILVKRTDLEPA